jgi:hypothetical protein
MYLLNISSILITKITKGDLEMGLRAYLMIDVAEDMEQKDFIEEIRQLEDMPGVDFVDPVIGPCDIVVMVDAPVTVEAIARKIQEKKWVVKIEVLRIVSMFERHRASKRELLKVMVHSGV